MWQYNVEFATSPNKHKPQKYVSNVSVSVLNMKFVIREETLICQTFVIFFSRKCSFAKTIIFFFFLLSNSYGPYKKHDILLLVS